MTRDRSNPERTRQAEQLAREAAALPPAQRDAFLDEACADDPPLRDLVAAMLPSEQLTRDPWDDPRRPSTRARRIDAHAGFAPGEVVGRYRIVREISRGGMGTVYEAEQDRPQRTVALKVLRLDLSDSSAIARFEYESRILARLHHPCIAQVYDAGTVEVAARPVPFIAMELIPGARSLVAYADEAALDARSRLALFAKVCRAVQHAHAQGVIHRDLKPANILVDPSGEPKIIDFGIARLTDADLAATRQTSVGQILGTVAYMSPEQCEADPGALDTRSDVYALGVVLYELLGRRLPYSIDGKLLHEALRIIREDPPTRLSIIDRAYRGDLETIVGKALEKDKGRRYQTASDLAADIDRFLNDEPVIARPPSAAYQLRKFAKRHTGLVAGAALVLALLVGAVAVITPLYLISERERARAALEAVRQEAVAQFLQDMLEAADPMRTRGEDLTVREMLDAAAVEVERDVADPRVRAIVEGAIGRAYGALGSERAREHLHRALDLHRSTMQDQPLRLARMLVLTAAAERVAGDYAATRDLVGEALALLDSLGPSPEAARWRSNALYYRGVASFHEGDLDGADADFRESYALLESSPDADAHVPLAGSAEAIANVAQMRGEFEEALAWYERSIEHERTHGGDESPGLAFAYGNLASLLHERGELDEAQRLAELSLAITRRVFGDDTHLQTVPLQVLGDIYADRGDAEAASSAFEQAIALELARFGEDHPDRPLSLWRYGYALLRLGQVERAEEHIRLALDLAVRGRGLSSQVTRDLVDSLADTAAASGAHALAEAILKPLYESVDPPDPHVGAALVRLYESWGRQDQAAQLRAVLPAEATGDE